MRASVERLGTRSGATSIGQHEKKLGPAWTGKGAPPPGFLRRREAQKMLEELLVDARRGLLRQQRTGLTFKDVAEQWYERGRFEQDWSASTRRDYRSILDTHLLPAFGQKRVEAITTAEIERWRERLRKEPVSPKNTHDGALAKRKSSRPRSRRTINKIVGQLSTVMEYATRHSGLAANPRAAIARSLLVAL